MAMSLYDLLLGLLNQKPMSGYDIKRYLKSLSWLIGSPSTGALYPALHSLQGDGLVIAQGATSPGRPPRKVYSITEAGKIALQEWAGQPVMTDLPLKAFIMRLILAGYWSGIRLRAQLQQRRTEVATHQDALQRSLQTLDPGDDLGQCLALDYGLAVAGAELAWLDSTLARLTEQVLQEDITGPGQ